MLKNSVLPKIKFLIKMLISILLLCLLFRQTPLEAMLKQLEQIELSWFFMAVFSLQIASIIQSIRWRTLIIMPTEKKPGILSFYYHITIGHFFNLFLPSGIGGDVVKSYTLGKKIKNVTRSVTALLLSRSLGVGALIILFWSLFWGTGGDAPLFNVFFMLLVTTGTFFFFYWILFSRQRLSETNSSRYPLLKNIATLINGLQNYRENRSLVLKGLAASIGIQVVIISCEYMMYRSVGVTLPYSAVFLFIPVIHLITMIPISLYGIGVREWISIQLFTLLPGIENEHCLAAIFIGYTLSFIQALIGGLLMSGHSLNYRGSQKEQD